MLIFDRDRRRVVGSIGWADRAAIWVFDLESKRTELISIPDTKHVEVRRFGDVVRIVHFGGSTPTISIRRLSDLNHDAAVLQIGWRGRPEFSGDADLWAGVDSCALLPTKTRTELIDIDAQSGSVRALDLNWYYFADYDLGYQGLIDCVTTPDGRHAIVSVQRSSRLVVLDIQGNKKVSEISLAGRSGNPLLTLLSSTQMLASDYDTMCRVDLDSMSLLASQRVQDGPKQGGRHFIGDYSIDEGGILVARPFSGDAVLLDGSDFSLLDRAVTGGEPLQAVRVSNDAVVARDWKTGRPLQGAFVGGA